MQQVPPNHHERKDMSNEMRRFADEKMSGLCNYYIHRAILVMRHEHAKQPTTLWCCCATHMHHTGHSALQMAGAQSKPHYQYPVDNCRIGSSLAGQPYTHQEGSGVVSILNLF